MTKNEIPDDVWNSAAVIESKEGEDTLIYHRMDIVKIKLFRQNLDSSKSVDSIMTIKVNTPESLVPCYKMQLSVELLKSVKQNAVNITKII